jgi:hypothetical protein
MKRIRSQLARVAAAWLLLHLSFLVSVPATLGATLSATSAVAEQCTCGHGDGQVCPMHHSRPKTGSPTDTRPCACGSPANPFAEMAASLIGPAAVLAPSAFVVVPLNDVPYRASFQPSPFESPSVPDSPPPRA